MAFLKKHRNDLVLILALLLVSGALFMWSVLSREEPDRGWIVAEIDGQEVKRLPLWENDSIILGDSEHSNTLMVINGGAYVIDASCPDKLCENQGEIRYEGQSIVCLPNKLIVYIEGGESSGIDAAAK